MMSSVLCDEMPCDCFGAWLEYILSNFFLLPRRVKNFKRILFNCCTNPFDCSQYSVTVRGLIHHALKLYRNSAEVNLFALSVCNVTG